MVIASALAAGGPALASDIDVTTTNDAVEVSGDCSLREAIAAADTDTTVDACAAGSGADTIRVPAGIYPITNPDFTDVEGLRVRSAVTLAGAGAATRLTGAGR